MVKSQTHARFFGWLEKLHPYFLSLSAVNAFTHQHPIKINDRKCIINTYSHIPYLYMRQDRERVGSIQGDKLISS